jgi:hypothetical protein
MCREQALHWIDTPEEEKIKRAWHEVQAKEAIINEAADIQKNGKREFDVV